MAKINNGTSSVRVQVESLTLDVAMLLAFLCTTEGSYTPR